jgi:hypothetical protein
MSRDNENGSRAVLKVTIQNVQQQNGYFMMFFPQPIETKTPVLEFVDAVNGKSAQITLPVDQVQNRLTVWWVASESKQPGDGRGCRRLGSYSVDIAPGVMEIECPISHISGQLVNVVKLLLELSGEDLERSRPAAMTMHNAQQLSNENEKQNMRFFEQHAQTTTHLPPWRGTSHVMPGCRIPTWGFLLEYAHPTQTVDNCTTLARLLQIAQHRVGLTPEEVSEPSEWSDTMLSELMCEIAGTLPRVCIYHSDTDPNSKLATKVTDQWIKPLLFRTQNEMEFDCEDGASTIFYVLRLLQTMSRAGLRANAPSELNRGLLAVSEFSRRYDFFFTIGTIRLPGVNEHTHHAWVTGIDAAQTPVVLGHEEPTQFPDHLPMLFIESTAYTTSTPDCHWGPDLTELHARSCDVPGLSVKIPFECMSGSQQYKTILCMTAPQLWTPNNPCEWVPMVGEVAGVSMIRVQHNGFDGVTFTGLANVSQATHLAMCTLLSTEPRVRGVPLVLHHHPFRKCPPYNTLRQVMCLGHGASFETSESKSKVGDICTDSHLCVTIADVPIARGCNQVEFIMQSADVEDVK